MLIKEVLVENPDLVRYYSDEGFMIHKIGTEEYYGEAVELATIPVEYEETNITIEESDEEVFDEGPEDEVENMRAALEVLGVTK